MHRKKNENMLEMYAMSAPAPASNLLETFDEIL